MPTRQFGFFLASLDQASPSTPSGSSGNLCLGGVPARFNRDILDSGQSGRFEFVVDTTHIPTVPVSVIVAGESWGFQAWYRDATPAATSNFTAGVEVGFQ